MPAFSTNIHVVNNKKCAIVPIFIAEGAQLEKAHDNNIQGIVAKGLVDTGATMTCVTKNLAEKLNLNPIGTILQSTASHQNVQTNSYSIITMIMKEEYSELFNDKSKKTEKKAFPISSPSRIQAGEFTNSKGSDIEVLIGMDIISLGVMIINGHDNRLTMAF